jgi:hypothetical protein
MLDLINDVNLQSLFVLPDFMSLLLLFARLKKATYSPNVGKYFLLLFLFELDHQ